MRDSSNQLKQKNEHDILTRELANVANIPKVYGAVGDGKGSFVALRLSPFGIPLKIAMSGKTRDEKAVFLLNMGIDILTILCEVHKLNVCHNDVRCPNILVIPSLPLRKQIAENPFGLEDNIPQGAFDSFSFLLNDWGESTHFGEQGKREAIVKDLSGLVNAICKSDFRESSVTPKSSNAELLRPPSDSIFPEKVFKKLNALATAGKTVALENELMKLL